MENALILVVDDTEKNLDLISTILKKNGYDTAIAGDGKQAIKKLEKLQPDLILLDIMLPEMDGYEVCRLIKSDNRFKNIPIIFQTAKNDTGDVIKGLQFGAADYITKPFNTTELLLRVKTQVTLKKSQDELREKNRELHRLIAAKDKLFSIISHDMKSPFQGLLGLTELLYEDYDQMKKSDIREFSKMIHEAARNLLNLLDNLLEWSLLERNKQYYNPEFTDLKTIVDKNIRLFSSNAENKGVTIDNRVSNPVTMWSDRNMIDTVIRNLLSNAIKYSREGDTVTLEVDKHSSHVIFRITDTGIGMSKDEKNNLFHLDKVKSTPGTNNEKGTGLGLLICKDLLKINGGDINLESTPGEGSTITIRLPASKAGSTEE